MLAQRRFYAAQMNLAMRAADENEPARALELLESVRPAFDDADLRGFEWYHVWERIHRGLVRRFNHHPGRVMRVQVFPDCKRIASAANRVIRVWDIETGVELAALPGTGDAFVISNDNRTICTWGEPGERYFAQLWDAQTGLPLHTFDGVGAGSFTPDGKQIAFVRGADVEFWDVATRVKVSSFRRENADLASGDDARGMIQIGGDGSVAIVRVQRSRLRLYRRRGETWTPGNEVPIYGRTLKAAFSPDGSKVALGSGEFHVYATDTGKELTGGALVSLGPSYDAAFSPDGKRLAAAFEDRTVRRLRRRHVRDSRHPPARRSSGQRPLQPRREVSRHQRDRRRDNRLVG